MVQRRSESRAGARRRGPGVVGLVALLVLVGAEARAAGDFDRVLAGGRVIDPESGLDAVRDVGIRAGRIVAVSETPLEADVRDDVAGLVVAPGFIDLHSHSPTPLGQRYQVQDGVTTQLELEAGAYPVAEFGASIRDRARTHFGASVGYGSIRLEVKLGLRQPHLIHGTPRPIGFRGYWTLVRSLFSRPTDVFSERATPGELARARERLDLGLDEGGLGIGFPLDYMSEGVGPDEARMVFEVAGERGVPVFIHLRRGVNGDPSGLREALGLAEETGAAVHVCHLQHNAMRNTELFLTEIRAARARGVDVTTEVLPYNAGSALISSAVFSRDWRTIFGIDYADVEWAETGKRFDEETWKQYRESAPDGQVIHHYVDESWTRRALAEPGVMVVSDLLPMVDETSKVAPHNGAFARVLGRYVRETELLTLTEALEKMTLLPARRLEAFAPAFARKGRIQVGADADLTVFDPDAIVDRARYGDPYRASAGIAWVLVGGEPVVREGALVENAFPGRRVQAPAVPAGD